MDLNSFVFPIPPPSYQANNFRGNLVYIPKKAFSYKDKLKYAPRVVDSKAALRPSKKVGNRMVVHAKSNSMINHVPSVNFTLDNKFAIEKGEKTCKNEYIPCLLYYPPCESDKILLYFHSNYEDIGNCSALASLISKTVKINVLVIEYPGYGIYHSKDEANAENILKDSETIFNFINDVMNINEGNIILMGRCLGSGPATYIASKHTVSALILLSPFKSIREAVKTMFPKLNLGNIIKNFVRERFNNMENIIKVTSPVLFIHGKMDTLIPPIHSIDLINKCKTQVKLVTPNQMTHNTFDYTKDIANNIKNFLKNFVIDKTTSTLEDTDENVNNEICYINFPKFMYETPKDIYDFKEA